MAKTRCPARYKNLGLETFGDKKKVTEEILKQCCKNDEWLRQNVEELRYLSPPAVRKSMQVGEMYDDVKSWGCDVNADGRVQFSNTTFDTISMDLSSEEGLSRWYDDVQSTTKLEHNDDRNCTVVRPDYTEVETQPEIVGTFGSGVDIKGYNSAWYVGFDKTKPFYLKPKWLGEGWKKYVTSTNFKKDIIDAVARAQTFKVPLTMVNSKDNSTVTVTDKQKVKLIKTDLQLEYNGTPTASSSPLHVQIWKTRLGWANVTEYDSKTRTVVKKYWTVAKHREKYGEEPPSSWQRYKKVTEKILYKKGKNKGKVKETKVTYKKDKNGNYIVKRRKVYRPKPNKGKSIQSPLGEYKYDPPNGETKGGEQTMDFSVDLEAGEHYAIVLLSPLNNWENCPRWGGWGRNCDVSKNYEHGNAFYSVDNGRSWKRYGKPGKDEDITVYRQGKQVPRYYRLK